MKKSEINENLIDRIIKVAYGDASLVEKIIIHLKASKNHKIGELLNEYKTTAGYIHSIEIECPDYVVNPVRKKIDLEKKISLTGIFHKLIEKPAITFSIVIIIAGLISFLVINEPPDYQGHTKGEIELAEKQVKGTLSFVGKIFKKTETELEKEIIINKVSKPINRGFSTINLLIGGQNE